MAIFHVASSGLGLVRLLGSQLALFPECYLQGYAPDRETIERRAIAVDSEMMAGVLEALAPFQVDIVFGSVERRRENLLNSAAVVRRGCSIGTYAKHHPNEEAFKAGTDSPIFTCARSGRDRAPDSPVRGSPIFPNNAISNKEN